MKIWTEDENKKKTMLGNLEYTEGEVSKEGFPTIYLLCEHEGKERKIFFEAASKKEYEDFLEDLKQALRH